ncbi:MAG: N-acetyltransferase family protein [Haloarculaceae archaeon]
MTVRQARADDRAAVAAFTADTWPDRDVTDYVPDAFPEWVESDGPRQRTFVADPDADGELAGLCQGVLLSDREAWAQGMRVNPDYRGAGVGRALNDALFRWAAEQGATVCRNMVFSWNSAGLGLSRGVGYEPVCEFRWAHPEPDADAAGSDDSLTVTDDPEAAWRYWQGSDARDALAGLALSLEETWALQELTPDLLARAAAETAVFAVRGDEGTRGLAYRTRVVDREDDERWAEYGVAGWADVPAAEALFAAVGRDAADLDATRTRVVIPETARHVSDAAAAGVGIGAEPDFVLAADLTGAAPAWRA